MSKVPNPVTFLLLRHFIFHHEVALIVEVTCNRWHTSVGYYSQNKLTCNGKNSGKLVIKQKFLIWFLLAKHVSPTQIYH
jgi:hypothetical protein